MNVLSVSFKEFFEILEAGIVKPANITFERYELLRYENKSIESPMNSAGEQCLNLLELAKSNKTPNKSGFETSLY